MFRRNSCRTVVPLIFALLALIQVGTCLECYSCNPLSGRCAEKFSSATAEKKTCTENNENACLKIEILGTITRTCGARGECEKLKICRACTENLCNTSSNIFPSVISSGFIALSIVKCLT